MAEERALLLAALRAVPIEAQIVLELSYFSELRSQSRALGRELFGEGEAEEGVVRAPRVRWARGAWA
jgi:hypothetical protein